MSMSRSNSSVLGYGFERPDTVAENDFNKFMDQYSKTLERRENRWNDKIPQLSGGISDRMMKRFIRKGIPQARRADVWLYLTKATQQSLEQKAAAYEATRGIKVKAEFLNVIKVDVPRTFPENEIFVSKKLSSLENVLRAFAVINIDIGYCQGMNFIAALLLLVVQDSDPVAAEHKVFHLLEYLVAEKFSHYYKSGMVGLQVDCQVLEELLRHEEPKIYKTIKQSNVNMLLLTTKWFICLFADVLPVETVFRIFDCLFLEGDKVIFRAAIALIKMHHKEIITCQDFPDLIKRFLEMCQDKVALFCHDFVREMFKIQLKRSQIQRLREHFSKTVENDRDIRKTQLAHTAPDSNNNAARASNGNGNEFSNL